MNTDQRLAILPLVIVTIGGLLSAILVGALVGKGDVKLIGVVGGAVVAVTLIVTLRQKVWLLLPFSWLLTGSMPFLPLPFSVRDLCIMFVFGTFLTMVALKIVREKPSYDFIDLVLLANVLYLATVFARNPAGLLVFGSERIGGRPYFHVALAVLAFWILARVRLTPRQSILIPLITILSVGVVGTLSVISQLFPRFTPYLSMVYSGFGGFGSSAVGEVVATTQDTGTGRLTGLQFFGRFSFVALCSYFRPLTMLLPLLPGRFTMFAISVVCILLSGYRSEVAYAAMIFALASYFRGRVRDCALLIVLGLPLVGLLVFGQGRFYQLPLSAQRALSFLPGHWDYTAVQEAKGSSEWRFDMWKEALTGKTIIKNRVLGDGFGFDIREWQALQMTSYYALMGRGGQEWMMTVGAFHSGPISTLRYAGLVGIFLYYYLMILLAMRAFRVIKSARAGPFYGVALFIGLPIIIHPVFFTIIFGGYDGAIVDTIFSVGMLKMLTNSISMNESREFLSRKAEAKLPAQRQQYEPVPTA